MELSIKQTTALDLLEDSQTNEILFGGGAGWRAVEKPHLVVTGS
jgi:hypothetical protein